MATGNTNIDPSAVPFDQYSRQLVVKNIIDKVFRVKPNGKKFSILDVGGYMGKTVEFLPNDHVDILDVFDIKAPNYIKGDATDVKKDDLSYDFVCSFDVLEHIPKNKREAFITESARLSKVGFFIAAPIDDKDGLVSLAEREANDVFKIVNKEDHRWLKEHIEYGIPTSKEIEGILSKHKLQYVAVKSNELVNWLSVQSTFFIKSVLERPNNFLDNRYLAQFHELHRLINKVYNENYDLLEKRQNVLSYRTVYFVSYDQKLVHKVDDYLHKNAKTVSGDAINKTQIEVYSNLFKVIAATISTLQKEGDDLKKEADDLRKMEGQLTALKQELMHKESYIKELQESRSWKMTKPFRQIVHSAKSIRKKD